MMEIEKMLSASPSGVVGAALARVRAALAGGPPRRCLEEASAEPLEALVFDPAALPSEPLVFQNGTVGAAREL